MTLDLNSSKGLEWDASDLSEALHHRRLLARELMERTYSRIDALNSQVNAMVNLLERQQAFKLADQADAELDAVGSTACLKPSKICLRWGA
jgi:Asp-tRNA(Asn)/Glu-tRNA(Gln) amidotransferase A subunit family amidase